MSSIEELKKSLEQQYNNTGNNDVNDDNDENDENDDSMLRVDDKIPGQEYCCVSFVNPEDAIISKNKWKFYKYHQYVIKSYSEILKNLTGKVLEKEEINPCDIVDLQERMNRVFKLNETNYNSWSELMDDYEYTNGENDNMEFDNQNNNQTSVRGVKIRGVYSTLKEAKVRASVLQKIDSRFHIYVVPVGYWVPSNPDPNKLSLKDQEYSNNELNTLVKSYLENESKKDTFYEEQTVQRINEENKKTTSPSSSNEKHNLDDNDQPNEQFNDVMTNNTTSKQRSVSTNDIAQQLNSDDIWLNRKNT